jgi:uncharacterized protein DUF4398
MRAYAICLVPPQTRIALLLLAALAIGCGTVRNPALEHARDLYQKARQDPMVVRHAATALDRAGQVLEDADRLWMDEKDVIEVEHLAYIVEKRTEIARVTAQRRFAADEIRQRRSPRPEKNDTRTK